jgi:DNA-binding transcriptional LysR family regulator
MTLEPFPGVIRSLIAMLSGGVYLGNSLFSIVALGFSLMPRKMDLEDQIGRRLRLRSLHVFFTVAQRGSMAKAAAQLGISTPTVSELIADLEHGLGVRLLDRSPKGVEPTGYGHALLRRTLVVFDELKQGIKDIEFWADPTAGEVRIASTATLTAVVLSQVIERFARQNPRAVVHQDEVTVFAANLSALRERKYDLMLARLDRPLASEEDDLNVEILFHDRMILAAGMHTRWARRRKIDLAELADEPWILSAPNTWNYARLMEAFQMRGLPMPKASAVTLSTPLRVHLLATGPYIASMSLRLHTDRHAIKVLPVDLPDGTTPIGLITLKNRTLSPVVECFIEHIRNFARPMREERPAPRR